MLTEFERSVLPSKKAGKRFMDKFLKKVNLFCTKQMLFKNTEMYNKLIFKLIFIPFSKSNFSPRSTLLESRTRGDIP